MSTIYPPIEVQRRDLSVPTDPIFRLSVDQYHEMIRSGILTKRIQPIAGASTGNTLVQLSQVVVVIVAMSDPIGVAAGGWVVDGGQVEQDGWLLLQAALCASAGAPGLGAALPAGLAAANGWRGCGVSKVHNPVFR